MFWLVLCVLSLATVSKCEQSYPMTSSISDAVRTGATMISRFLNSKSNQAFSFIFSKFSKSIEVNRKWSEDQRNKFILLALRLMGVDKQKLTNFAFNGFIALIHLMNQVLIKNGARKRKDKTQFSLFRFVLSQPQVSDLLIQMQDPKLIDMVLKESEEKLKFHPKEDTDCIKVLICRAKPFVLKMQESLKFFMNRENIEILGDETCNGRAEEDTCRRREEDAAWEKANLEDRMYFFVPSLQEVVERGDECDLIFPHCIY